MKALLIFLAIALAPIGTIWAEDVERALTELAKPLTEDKIFYRWGSVTSGENLHKMGTLDESMNRYFMNLKTDIAAGPGFYMADNIHGSAGYLPEHGGNVVEIRIPKGTPFIDAEDPVVKKRLKELGFKDGAELGGKSIKSPVVIRYSGDWLVGKNLTGRAHFTLFPGPDATLNSIRSAYDSLEYQNRPQEQVIEQIKKQRPDLHKKIDENLVLGDKFSARLASLESTKKLLANAIAQESSRKSVADLVNTLVYSPYRGQIIHSQEEFVSGLRETLIKNANPFYLSQLAKDLPEDWVAEFLLARQNATWDQRTFWKEYLARISDFADSEFVERIKGVEKILSARGQSFSVELKAILSEKIEEQIVIARNKGVRRDSLSDLLDERYIANESIKSLKDRLANLERYVVAFDKMLAKPTAGTVREVLGEAQGLREVKSVVSNLVKHPDVVGSVLRAEPDLLARHFVQIPPAGVLGDLVEDFARVKINIVDLSLDSVMRLQPKARGQFLEDCLINFGCRKIMSRQWSRLLKDIEDISGIMKALGRTFFVYTAVQIEKEIFEAISTPNQLRSFHRISGSEILEEDLLKKIKLIGVDKFHGQEIYRIVDVKKLGAAPKKLAMMTAVRNVVNAEDAIIVQKQLRELNLDRTEVAHVLERKMQSLNPNLDEIEQFRKVRGEVGRDNLKPATQIDCISSWSRSLRSP